MKFSPDQLDALKSHFPLSVLIGRDVALKKRGAKHLGLCPFHAERTPSFQVDDTRGLYHCFGCGAGGDVLKYVEQTKGFSFVEAVEWLAGQAGTDLEDLEAVREAARKTRLARERFEAEERARKADDVVACARLFRDTVPAAGTGAQAYLMYRGIQICPESLRFAPSLPYYHQVDGRFKILGWFPAMVAPLQLASGAFSGVHITYLDTDFSRKAEIFDPSGDKLPAKKMRGNAWGAAIRLGPVSGELGIAEGIETSLSVMQECPPLVVWAAGSLWNMAGGWLGRGLPHPDRPGKFLPTEAPDPRRPAMTLPPIVQTVRVLGDADGRDRATGQVLLRLAARKFASLHGRAFAAPAADGQDYNDMLQGGDYGHDLPTTRRLACGDLGAAANVILRAYGETAINYPGDL